MAQDADTRAIIALERESARMSDAAERVRLVVRALALRRGVKTTEGESGASAAG